MAANPQIAMSGLGRALVQHGRLGEAEALACSQDSGGKVNAFMAAVIEKQHLSALDLARFSAETFGYPLFDVAALDAANIPRDAIDKKLISKHEVIALGKRGNRLTVAMADPTNIRALDQQRTKWQLTRRSR